MAENFDVEYVVSKIDTKDNSMLSCECLNKVPTEWLFSDSKQKTMLYYIKFEYDKKTYYKIGITESLRERFSSEDKDKFKLIDGFSLKNIKDPKAVESKIKELCLKNKAITHDILKSGNTEVSKTDFLGCFSN